MRGIKSLGYKKLVVSRVLDDHVIISQVCRSHKYCAIIISQDNVHVFISIAALPVKLPMLCRY